ncbi:hypothetical protein [Vibrio harveyi]|uniref:hypothetical protein n=1 Tax=Vibrio harveyi TaxID=669 RepID=UPI000A957DF9|nr:hypothetical protein [Vibrio harveyi]
MLLWHYKKPLIFKKKWLNKGGTKIESDSYEVDVITLEKLTASQLTVLFIIYLGVPTFSLFSYIEEYFSGTPKAL